jgi:hypothetical protein
MSRFLAAIVLLAVVLVARPSRPCAPAPPAGMRVDIVAEEAIVVWDPERKREHFIRRADFRSEASGFGFLVPTPSKPELAEADDTAFARLHDRIRPPIDRETRYEVVWALCSAMWLTRAGSDASSAPPAQVRVLEETRVAGYDAAVLEADDAGALAAWLKDHGYAFRPALDGWLAPCVAARWKITAFKVAKTDGTAEAATLGTSAVRMSFDTDRPFFPYREPADQGDERASRSLRVFVVAPGRMEGTLGASTRWPHQLHYAKEVADAAALLAGALGAADVPASPWLTVLEDWSSRRPGNDDLFFAPHPSQLSHEPPPIWMGRTVTIPLLLDVVAVVLLLGWGGFRLVRRRKPS